MANLVPIGPDVESQPLNDNFAALNDDIINVPHWINRNTIINGGFDIWQRGTSFDANGYTADRWIVGFGAGGAGTVTRQSFTPGQTDVPGEPQYYMRISQTTPTASGHVVLGQRIEDVRSLAGQTVTLSFYARVGSGNKVIGTRVQQNFGSGGSPNEDGPGKAHTITTSWQRFTHTFAVPSISGKTIGSNNYLFIRFLEESNYSTFNIDFANIQLHVGDVELPFQPRHIAEEWELCRRYTKVIGRSSPFQVFGHGYANTATEAYIFIPLSPRGRVVPTLTSSGSFRLGTPGGPINVTSMSVSTALSSPDLVVLQVSVASGLTSGQSVALQANNDDNAILIFDMEL